MKNWTILAWREEESVMGANSQHVKKVINVLRFLFQGCTSSSQMFFDTLLDSALKEMQPFNEWV